MANFFASYPGVVSSITASNPSVSANGSPIPGESTLVAGENPSGNQQPLQTDSSGNLLVAGTFTATNPSVGPAGVAVPIDATYAGMNVSGDLVGLEGTTNGLKVDGSAVTQPISAASLPLPTGASTAANQATEITALGTINTTLGSPMQNSGGSVTANAGTNLNTSALATSANLTSGTQKTQIVDGSGNVIASTSNALNVNVQNPSTSSPVNANGSFSQASISVATTITKPANAVGFLLEADSANTDFMRWCDSNSTASATNGMKLEPGRDTGFMPMSHNLSICPNTSSQTYTVQWVLSS